MGANRFYDFILLHRYLGIKEMVSVERDPVMFKRAAFNVPYRFINVVHGEISPFIAEDQSNQPTIYWLDYDGRFSQAVVDDIAIALQKLKHGDFFFVTINVSLLPDLEELSSADRLKRMNDLFSDLSSVVDISDVEDSTFERAVRKMIIALTKYHTVHRHPLVFSTLLNLRYADGTQMLTVGGSLLDSETADKYAAAVKLNIPFLDPASDEPYKIKTPNVTERERMLLDVVSTATGSKLQEEQSLLEFGVSEAEISCYKDLLRYLPRYVETFL